MEQQALEEAMEIALEEARMAFDEDEVPVGAVVLGEDLRPVARAHNLREQLKDPTAHAELLALREAARVAGDWRLTGCVLVCTLEPCLMCAGAALLSRIATIAYGAADPKAGACGSLYNVASDPRLNHEINLIWGLREEDCARLLSSFFEKKRR